MTTSEKMHAVNGRKTTNNESEWVVRAKQGEQVAWTRLVRRHEAPVFRLAYLILGDAAEAEEAAQDAFIRAYRALDSFDVERPFRPWILSIAANVARNRRRSLGRYWTAVRRYWQAQPAPPVASPPHQQRTEAHLLWQAVQKLNPKAREVVYLRYFLALSEAETAESLAIAPGTVKSRLHRALKQLKGIIERDFPELAD